MSTEGASVNVTSNAWFVCGQEEPSLPSVSAAHVCQLIWIISTVRVCGHPDVHVGHMFQKHVLVLVLLLPSPWALKHYMQHDCIRGAAVDADHGDLAPPGGRGETNWSHEEPQRAEGSYAPRQIRI